LVEGGPSIANPKEKLVPSFPNGSTARSIKPLRWRRDRFMDVSSIPLAPTIFVVGPQRRFESAADGFFAIAISSIRRRFLQLRPGGIESIERMLRRTMVPWIVWLRKATTAPTMTFIAIASSSVVGLLVMAGWFFDWPHAKTVFSGLPAMSPGAAMGVCLAGVALGSLRDPAAGVWPRRFAAG
jgi:hypothetical protein